MQKNNSPERNEKRSRQEVDHPPTKDAGPVIISLKENLPPSPVGRSTCSRAQGSFFMDKEKKLISSRRNAMCKSDATKKKGL